MRPGLNVRDSNASRILRHQSHFASMRPGLNVRDSERSAVSRSGIFVASMRPGLNVRDSFVLVPYVREYALLQ